MLGQPAVNLRDPVPARWRQLRDGLLAQIGAPPYAPAAEAQVGLLASLIVEAETLQIEQLSTGRLNVFRYERVITRVNKLLDNLGLSAKPERLRPKPTRANHNLARRGRVQKGADPLAFMTIENPEGSA